MYTQAMDTAPKEERSAREDGALRGLTHDRLLPVASMTT